jgi:hypothetical protein
VLQLLIVKALKLIEGKDDQKVELRIFGTKLLLQHIQGEIGGIALCVRSCSA